MTYTIEATSRVKTGKGANRALRRSGCIPAVLYGDAMLEAQNVSLNEREFCKLYAEVGYTNLVQLSYTDAGGGVVSYPVVFWNVQIDPVKRTIQHVDILKVDTKRKLRVRVPLVFEGVAKGMKLGGKLEVFREYIDIEALPENLVSKVVVDITEMDANTQLKLSEINMPPNVDAIYKQDVLVISITLKQAEA